jgi:hypothetical protein
MHNDQSSSSSAGNLSGRMSCSCSRSTSRSCSQSCSCSSSRSYNNHHVAQDDCKLSTLPKCGYLTPPRVMMVDTSIALTRAILFLPHSPLQWQRKVIAPRNRESPQQRIYVSHCMSLFQIGNQTF